LLICSHPHVRDICDIGQIIFGGSKIAYELTMVGLILNNVFIQALHIVVGEKVLNTLSNHAICTVAFGAILTVVYVICIPLLPILNRKANLKKLLFLVLWLDFQP